MRTVYAQKNKKIILGRQGEDKAVRVVWPGIVSDWSSLYGDGSFQLSVRRFGDENAYPVVVEVNGDDVIFTVTSAETAIAGIGKCELTYIANGTIAKSATWETVVLNSLTGKAPSEPPEEPAKSWFTAIQGQIGNLADLATSSKDNLVAAINEAAQSGGGGGASVELDTTLTQSGKAADAKAVGDALAGKQQKGDYLTRDELPDMTAYRTAEAQDVIDAGKQDTLIQSGATVGQIAKITAVDETGKPTAWEAVDMPSGGGGGDEWELIADVTISEPVNSISADVPSGKNELLLFARGTWGAEPSNKRVGFKINGRWNASSYKIASSWRYFKMHIIRLPQGYVWFEQQQNNMPTGGGVDLGIEAEYMSGIYEPWKMLPNEISNVSFSMIGADGTLNTGFQFMVFGR